MTCKKVAVIGAGAAGLMAAGTAAQCGASVTLIEKNPRVGRKIMITGKGRCNILNNCDVPAFITNVPVNGRFLYSAVSRFSPSDAFAFFEGIGLPLKTERGNRCYPQSDKAVDVVDALRRFVLDSGVTIVQDTAGTIFSIVPNLRQENGGCSCFTIRRDDHNPVRRWLVCPCHFAFFLACAKQHGREQCQCQYSFHCVLILVLICYFFGGKNTIQFRTILYPMS